VLVFSELVKLSRNLTILKIGGSLITDKSKPYTFNHELIQQISQEIGECLRIGILEDLIIIHGVGSFGHPPVLEHGLYRGFQNKEQLIPLSNTQAIVNKLRDHLTSELRKCEVPIVMFHASSLCTANKGMIQSIFVKPIAGFLSVGMIPLIGGDMVSDESMGFSVCSGDQIATILALEMNPVRILFATDVSGVYSTDPNVNPDIKPIMHFDKAKLQEFLYKAEKEISKSDASGMMIGKLKTILALSEKKKDNFRVSIFSMNQPGNLKKILQNEPFAHTEISF